MISRGIREDLDNTYPYPDRNCSVLTLNSNHGQYRAYIRNGLTIFFMMLVYIMEKYGEILLFHLCLYFSKNQIPESICANTVENYI